MLKIRNDEESSTLLELFVKLERANRTPAPDLREEKIEYGPDARQYCLTFYPEGRAVCKHILIFLHGGGWRMGSPEEFRCIGRFFARLGYVTILPAYRLVPDYRFPVQMEDVFAATLRVKQWLAENQGLHGKAIIVGQSAGAHLGALLLYNQAEQAKYGLHSDDFAGFVSISGPLNFSVCKNRSEIALLRAFVRGAEDWVRADPFHYLTGSVNGLPKVGRRMYKVENPLLEAENILSDADNWSDVEPHTLRAEKSSRAGKYSVLCIHGDADTLVEIENSTTFVDEVNATHPGLAQLLIVPGGHHSDLVKLFLGEMKEVAVLQQWLQERE